VNIWTFEISKKECQNLCYNRIIIITKYSVKNQTYPLFFLTFLSVCNTFSVFALFSTFSIFSYTKNQSGHPECPIIVDQVEGLYFSTSCDSRGFPLSRFGNFMLNIFAFILIASKESF
jgi:hypothetical protein